MKYERNDHESITELKTYRPTDKRTSERTCQRMNEKAKSLETQTIYFFAEIDRTVEKSGCIIRKHCENRKIAHSCHPPDAYNPKFN